MKCVSVCVCARTLTCVRVISYGDGLYFTTHKDHVAKQHVI